MSDPMALKWAIVDLLKICDAAHEGRLHGDLARIARTLGVELTEPVFERVIEDTGGIYKEIDLRKAKKATRGVS